ncbi:MAG: TonB-dependent receptor [Pseudomonadota bacterium]
MTLRPVLLLFVFLLLHTLANAQETCLDGLCSTVYDAQFFQRYAPTSALDMIRNLPGYALDDGDLGQRGFGGAAGNLLIDGERVSSKSESPSDLLRRIPAANVQQIVLLRGQLAGFDLANQSLVANVILNNQGTSGSWRLRANQYRPDSSIFKGGNLNLAGEALGLRYNAAVGLGDYLSLVEADERVFDANGQQTERRDERFEEKGKFYVASLTADGQLGQVDLSLNARRSGFEEDGGEQSLRRPAQGTVLQVFQGDADEGDDWELGFDLERALGRLWSAKFIGLVRREHFAEQGLIAQTDFSGPSTDRVRTRFNSVSRELIGRFEFDFSGFEGHILEWSVEATDNILDSRFALFVNEGSGLAPVEVPGAETEVSERRYDLTVSDAFSLGAVSIDLAVGAERSQIEQQGGFSESRSFTFLKPSLLATYALSAGRQIRLGLRREIGQLDFFDFVSSADLGDDELELGNPSLKPERTTRAEGVFEQRFTDVGSASLTIFHDRIRDVEDLLPLEGVLEVPGNIGDGQRTGIAVEVTAPLDKVGLMNSRLDIEWRWQTSAVDDPLSGRSRVLSGERQWDGAVTLRQDLPASGFAWSIKAFAEDDRPQFGLDEFDRRGERFDIDAFVELRVSSQVRLQLGVENLLRDGDARDRQVFAGPRSNGQLAFREVRERSFAREVFMRMTGTF